MGVATDRIDVYEALFQPLDLAGTTIPNRVVRTAHSTGAPWVDRDGSLVAYVEARARGGVGLSILDIAGVHPSSTSGIPVYADRVVDGYRTLIEATRPHGMALMQQLWHGGSAVHGSKNKTGGPPWSASDVPNPLMGLPPTPMSKGQIDEVVESFALAAGRVQAGGLDGVEIHGAHGYLVGQFLSSATNRREDDYGGSLENRVRFLREIVRAIRATVGPEFPIGVRLSADEEYDGGMVTDDAIGIAGLIEPDIDFLNVSLSSHYNFARMAATMEEPLAYELPKSGMVTAAVDVPTIVTGRIMTLEDANRIVADGVSDMVSMVRALIADPDLVRKSRDGRAAEVRPCTGSAQGCVGSYLSTQRMRCVVNPSVGSELSVPVEVGGRTGSRKRILVIGGGPAGMEAARTAAIRGHDVVLHEMTSRLGGQVEIAAAAPGRSDMATFTRWLADELVRLDVVVKLRSFVDPDVIAAEAPDAIVMATGSTPRRDGFQVSHPALVPPGVDLPHVVSSWDVFGFGGRATIGTSAVVYDDPGTYEAVSVAEALVAAGAHVTFVTRHDTMGAEVPGPLATVDPAKHRLLAAGCRILPASYVVAITPSHVVVDLLHGGDRREVPADTVVFVTINTPNRDLADAIDFDGPVHLIGDVTGSRTLQEAVKGATRVSRAL